MIDDDTIPAAENIPKWLWLVAVLAFFGLVAVAVEGWLSSHNAEEMGQWGDFLGGTLNPILTFLTVAGLLYTIMLQRSELRLSREELVLTRKELKTSAEALQDQNESMKQQRFESTLFSMIGVLNQIIGQMDVSEFRFNPDGEDVSRGRDSFSALERKLASIYGFRAWTHDPYDELINPEKPWGGSREVLYPHDRERILQAYSHFYDQHAPDLGHYFRVLFNIFMFIRASEYKNPIYQKILRAQLSNQELFILYYNCSSPIGEKFRELAVEFALFDNMETKRLIRADHIKLLPKEAFGNNPMILPVE
jgi:Putative phage abortive infection protein